MVKMKAYIVEYGEVVSTAKFAGNFEDMWDAKKALIHDMSDGDEIALFPDDADPLYTDQWGYETVDTEDAEEVAVLHEDDGTLDVEYGEDVPDDDFYWFDDDLETIWDTNRELWCGF